MLKVYSKDNCSKCVELKTWLSEHGHEYEEIDVVSTVGARDFLVSGGFRTVPQVFLSTGEHFGDCDNTIKKLKEK